MIQMMNLEEVKTMVKLQEELEQIQLEMKEAKLVEMRVAPFTKYVYLKNKLKYERTSS